MSVSLSHWLGLQGRVVAVTGAASGIGAAAAHQLAEAGAHVALIDRDAEGVQRHAAALIAEFGLAGVRTLAVTCDIASEEQTLAAVVVMHGMGLTLLIALLALELTRGEVLATDTQRLLLTTEQSGVLFVVDIIGRDLPG